MLKIISEKQIRMCRHAWGADSRQPGYRNKFVTTNTDDDMNWLVNHGYFKGPFCVDAFGEDTGLYSLTRKGIELVKEITVIRGRK